MQNEIINVVSTYALSEDFDKGTKEKYWNELNRTIEALDQSKLFILKRDFNAHIVTDRSRYVRVYGGIAYGNGDREGDEMLKAAPVSDATIVNSFLNENLCLVGSVIRWRQLE